MRPIRIHLGPMPAMLRTIVGDLLRREPDIVLVSDAASDALRHAREVRADILITQEGAGEPSSCLETILCGERLGICALSADGTSAAAINLVRRPIAGDDCQGFSIAMAIRGMAEMLAAESAGEPR